MRFAPRFFDVLWIIGNILSRNSYPPIPATTTATGDVTMEATAAATADDTALAKAETAPTNPIANPPMSPSLSAWIMGELDQYAKGLLISIPSKTYSVSSALTNCSHSAI